MKDKIWNIRTCIYTIGIAAFVVAYICKCTSAYAVEYDFYIKTIHIDDSGNNVFWPPDMIPHPSCPGDGPGENKEPVMS